MVFSSAVVYLQRASRVTCCEISYRYKFHAQWFVRLLGVTPWQLKPAPGPCRCYQPRKAGDLLITDKIRDDVFVTQKAIVHDRASRRPLADSRRCAVDAGGNRCAASSYQAATWRMFAAARRRNSVVPAPGVLRLAQVMDLRTCPSFVRVRTIPYPPKRMVAGGLFALL